MPRKLKQPINSKNGPSHSHKIDWPLTNAVVNCAFCEWRCRIEVYRTLSVKQSALTDMVKSSWRLAQKYLTDCAVHAVKFQAKHVSEIRQETEETFYRRLWSQILPLRVWCPEEKGWRKFSTTPTILIGIDLVEERSVPCPKHNILSQSIFQKFSISMRWHSGSVRCCNCALAASISSA